jgi:hypothetical protein
MLTFALSDISFIFSPAPFILPSPSPRRIWKEKSIKEPIITHKPSPSVMQTPARFLGEAWGNVM